ncbi:MAG: pilus assembly protein PilP [Desulfobacteraceae bacterium]
MLKLKHINRKNIFHSAILLAALFIFSVFPAEAKTGETGQKTQDEPPALKGSAGTEKKERKYLYNPAGKTDPFKSFIVEQEAIKKNENEKPRTYLETLELSQLTVSVIIIGQKDKWAMVKDNKGDGHVIKEGTPIGINRGVVYKIQPHEVIIREEVRDSLTGKKVPRDVVKKTPSDN